MIRLLDLLAEPGLWKEDTWNRRQSLVDIGQTLCRVEGFRSVEVIERLLECFER